MADGALIKVLAIFYYWRCDIIGFKNPEVLVIILSFLPRDRNDKRNMLAVGTQPTVKRK